MNDAAKAHDKRIFASVEQLSELEYKANAFLLKPMSKVSSLRAGHHLSQFRGRGLAFEEYRQYVPGDDVRDIDWRVSMRTRNPMMKVFNEEKDLPVVLIVDQRNSMLFSTVDTMKSVVAAEIAALCAWQVTKAGDRVGAVLYNDHEAKWLAPKRSKQHLSQILGELVRLNQKLLSSRNAESLATNQITQSLHKAAGSKIKGGLFVVISDFQGFDDQSKQALRMLQENNDVVGVLISDPLEKQFSEDMPRYLTDGNLQLQTPSYRSALAQKYADVIKAKTERIKTDFALGTIPLVELSTDGNHIHQFQQALSVKVL